MKKTVEYSETMDAVMGRVMWKDTAGEEHILFDGPVGHPRGCTAFAEIDCDARRFLAATDTVAHAVKNCGVVLPTGPARMAFILRVFYLLGVQQGAELHHWASADGGELTQIPFSLDNQISVLAAEDFDACKDIIRESLGQLGLRF